MRLLSGLLIVSGVIFITLGVVVQKSDPDRVWAWNGWAEFPDWSSWIYIGAFFFLWDNL